MADEITTTPRGALRILFGAVDLVTALIVYATVFEGLPSRYWPVDSSAVVLCLLFVGAGVGLLSKARWARLAASVAAGVSLVMGLGLVTTLALTASYLAGIYGAIGRGGSLILSLAAALALPYLVVLPLTQLAWLGRGRHFAVSKERAPSGDDARAAAAGS